MSDLSTFAPVAKNFLTFSYLVLSTADDETEEYTGG